MRKHHYKLKGKEEVELNITSFLNLMVVLVPFLLITAVFSRRAQPAELDEWAALGDRLPSRGHRARAWA
jgi:biopolymer transport protein ExbD